MRKNFARVSILFIALMIISIISGVAAAAQKQTLRVGVEAWMLKKFDLQNAAQIFMKDHPEVEVEYVQVETADNTSYLLQWSQKKTSVDMVIGGSRENAVPYVAKDLLMNFDEGFFDQKVAREDFIPAFLDLGKIEGTQYLIPIQGQIMYVTVRKDLMKKAGLTDKEGNVIPAKNWDEFYEYAKKLTEKEDNKVVTSGLAIDWGKNFMAYSYLSSLQGVRGSIYANEKSNIIDFRSDEASHMLKVWNNLVKDGYTPVDTFADMDAGRSNFQAGNVAMHISSVSRWKEASEILGADKVTGMPLPGADRNGTIAFVSGIMIPKVSENPELAKLFIKERLMDREFQLWTLNKYGKMPVLKRNYEGADAPIWSEILKSAVKAGSCPLYKDWPRLDNEMNIQLQSAIMGKTPIEKVLKNLDGYVRSINTSSGL
ncbi:extracellular solute-binding protein [Aminobacterium sp. MB27-C1]|jgi:ABC-type glycerol-3-phosphate transport system substrate-binding protein|uniref:ABC transporter substrate-binding protein n=1 Tax=unclassified Aminobacterium TaxID=2685012 RepID=UPI001BCE9816|nr:MULTISPECIES: extracellular solute-binding protein [unclassified Aminobacterium]MEA4878472.1 extracellular solute-binding protein [Aminobacterium sp.]WMI71017.1 extracellular solute-binding protein [Aminobacterium sp. MB27-C1]